MECKDVRTTMIYTRVLNPADAVSAARQRAFAVGPTSASQKRPITQREP